MKKPVSRPVRLVMLLMLLAAALAYVMVLRGGRNGAEWEWYNRGINAGAQGNIPAAQVGFERAIQINPRFTLGYEWLARTCLVTGQRNRALTVLHRLHEVDPDYPHLSIFYAEAYIGSDNISMLRWARAALLQEPQSPRARLLFALGLARSGNSRDALKEMAVANRLSPSPLLSASLRNRTSLLTKPQAIARQLAALAPQMSL